MIQYLDWHDYWLEALNAFLQYLYQQTSDAAQFNSITIAGGAICVLDQRISLIQLRLGMFLA